MSDIILAAMPYMSLNWPSLALGQLTAAARQSGLDLEKYVYHLRFCGGYRITDVPYPG